MSLEHYPFYRGFRYDYAGMARLWAETDEAKEAARACGLWPLGGYIGNFPVVDVAECERMIDAMLDAPETVLDVVCRETASVIKATRNP